MKMTSHLSVRGLALALACGLATVFFSACEKKQEAPLTEKQKGEALDRATSHTNGGVLSAPVDYLGATIKGQQQAIKTVDVASLNSAVQQYFAGEGQFPKDLNELVEKHYISKIPAPPIGTKIDYDPSSGVVKVVKL